MVLEESNIPLDDESFMMKIITLIGFLIKRITEKYAGIGSGLEFVVLVGRNQWVA